MGDEEGGAGQERKAPWGLPTHRRCSQVGAPRLRDQIFGGAHHHVWSLGHEAAGALPNGKATGIQNAGCFSLYFKAAVERKG